MQLDTATGVKEIRVGTIGLGNARSLRQLPPQGATRQRLIGDTGGVVHRRAAGLHLYHHVRGLVFHRLVGRDHPAELHPLLEIIHGAVQRLLRPAQLVGGDRHGCQVYDFCEHRPATAGLSQQRCRRHVDIIKHQLRLPAGLVHGRQPLPADARSCGGQHKQADALGAVTALLPGRDNQQLGRVPVGHVAVAATDPVAITVRHAHRLHRIGIPAAATAGISQGARSARRQLRQVFGLLLLTARHQQRIGGETH